jgi:hypothetical protein
MIEAVHRFRVAVYFRKPYIRVEHVASGAEPMPKVSKGGSSAAKVRNGRGIPVRGVRMQRPDGVTVRVVPLDTHSPTFEDDLTEIFQRNIDRARRENKKLFGSPDGPAARK